MEAVDVRAPIRARKHGLGARLRRGISVDIPGVVGAIHRHFGGVAVAHYRDGAHVLVLGIRCERQGIVAAHRNSDVDLPVAEPRAGGAHVLVRLKILPAARTAARAVVGVPHAVLIHDAELELIADIEVDGDGKFVLALRLLEDVAVLALDGPAVPADGGKRPARRRTARDQPLPRVLLGGRPHRIDVGIPLDGGVKTPVVGEVRRREPAFEDESLLLVALIRGRKGGNCAALLHFPLGNDGLPVEEGHRKGRRLVLRVLAGSHEPEREKEHEQKPEHDPQPLAQCVCHTVFPPYPRPQAIYLIG